MVAISVRSVLVEEGSKSIFSKTITVNQYRILKRLQRFFYQSFYSKIGLLL